MCKGNSIYLESLFYFIFLFNHANLIEIVDHFCKGGLGQKAHNVHVLGLFYCIFIFLNFLVE